MPTTPTHRSFSTRAVATSRPRLTSALLTLAQGARLSEVTATATDDPSDAVDATQFIAAFSNAPLGTASCAAGLTERDTDFDGIADSFLAVPAGTPLCWNVVPATNSTVQPTASAQLFRVTVSVNDTGFQGLDQQQVIFVVPPSN